MSTRSPQKAPKSALHREGVATVDPALGIPQEQGVNFNGYEFAHFTILPAGGANPTVLIYAWSEESSEFVPLLEAEAQPAPQGANAPYAFTIRAAGRILLARISVLVAGTVDVEASGWDANGGAA